MDDEKKLEDMLEILGSRILDSPTRRDSPPQKERKPPEANSAKTEFDPLAFFKQVYDLADYATEGISEQDLRTLRFVPKIYYDTCRVTSLVDSGTYFVRPVGMFGKTRLDTNLTMPCTLGRTTTFVFSTLILRFLEGSESDRSLILQKGLLSLDVANIVDVELPVSSMVPLYQGSDAAFCWRGRTLWVLPNEVLRASINFPEGAPALKGTSVRLTLVGLESNSAGLYIIRSGDYVRKTTSAWKM